MEFLYTLLFIYISCIYSQETIIPFDRPVSIVMTMIVRDEAVNFNANLELWLPVVDYFVFMVDSRTTDGSNSTIVNILDGRAKGYKIFDYLFDGFGSARTESLQKAYEYFPQATHVWISDPDWRPDTTTMKLEDINIANADVYRFLIYDRNGETTRRIDWLLKNREGLAMRYALHEVLDIGARYDWVPIDWVCYEIEKPGSWHSTVGHGNSMSAKRYLFDLELLYKDVETYGHDPHTHYYLGVTHEAYAEKLLKSGIELTNEDVTAIQHHIEKAIYYLKLRATSEYNDEFPEERWGVMLMLGSVYGSLDPDFTKAEHWLSMCRDYNPRQVECTRALVSLYLGYGMPDEAIDTVSDLIRTDAQARIMLNHFKLWSCDVPAIVYQTLLIKFRLQRDRFESVEFKYILVLKVMIESEFCQSNAIELPPDEYGILQAMSLTYEYSTSASAEELCNDKELMHYIHNERITLQPCESIKNLITSIDTCSVFNQHLQPSGHENQLIHQQKTGQDPIGIASIPEIVHFILGGETTRLRMIEPSKRFRVLFIQPSSTSAILTMLKLSFSRLDSGIQMAVLASSQMIEKILSTIKSCEPDLLGLGILDLHTLNDGDLLTHSSGNQLLHVDTLNGPFDYIDINGCHETMLLSAASVPINEQLINLLKIADDLLSPEGVIGLTAFALNKHVTSVQSLLKFQNKKIHEPFSTEASRLIESYLESESLSVYKEDKDWIKWMSSEINDVTFTQSTLIEMMDDIDLQPMTWFPTAFSNPYEELDDYNIRKYWSYGMSEEQFVHQFMPTFRIGVYISRQGADIIGRMSVESLLKPGTDISKVHVLDRSGGSLGLYFHGAAERGAAMLSKVYHRQIQTFSNKLSYVVMPYELPGMQLLNGAPTIMQMVQLNAQVRSYSSKKLVDGVQGTLAFLNFLAATNAITLWISDNNTDASHGISNISNKGRKDRKNRKSKINDMFIEGLQSDLQEELMAAQIRKKMQMKGKIRSALTQSDGAIRSESTSSYIDSNTNTASQAKAAKTQAKAKSSQNSRTSNRNSASGGGLDKGKQSKIIGGMSVSKKRPQKSSFNTLGGKVAASSPLDKDSENKKETHDVNFGRSMDIDNDGIAKEYLSTVTSTLTASDIQLPRVQSYDELISGPRDISCGKKINVPSHCDKFSYDTFMSVKFTTKQKVQFDIAQLRSIAFSNKTAANFILKTIIPAMQNDIRKVEEENVDLEDDELFVLPQGSYFNRLISFAPDKNENKYKETTDVIYDEAGKQLGLAMRSIFDGQSFAVIDSLLKPTAMRSMTSLLLSSTYFFDRSNDAVHLAHPQDGLGHSSIEFTIRQIALLASVNLEKHLNVKHYAAFAVDITNDNTGPVIETKQNEVAALLWLNPGVPVQKEDSDLDGLRVYAGVMGACLERRGYLPHISHPFFLSSADGKLNIDVDTECLEEETELITRKSDRIIFIGPGLVSRLQNKAMRSIENKSFNMKTAVGIYMIFEMDR